MKLIENMRPEEALFVRKAFLYYDKLGKGFPYEWELFWRKWGEIDPEAALADTKIEPDPIRANLYHNIFYSMARDHTAEAIKWLNSNNEDPHYESAFLSFVSGYSVKDLSRATDVTLSSLPSDDPLLQKALAKLADSAFAIGSASGLKEWFNQLPANNADMFKARNLAMNGIYGKLVRADVTDAAQWVGAQALTPWRNDSGIGYTAFHYAAANPEAAAEWIASLPPASRPNEPIQPIIGIPELANNWLRKDPRAFGAWLESEAGTNANMYQQTRNWLAKQLPANSPVRQYFPGLPPPPAPAPPAPKH